LRYTSFPKTPPIKEVPKNPNQKKTKHPKQNQTTQKRPKQAKLKKPKNPLQKKIPKNPLKPKKKQKFFAKKREEKRTKMGSSLTLIKNNSSNMGSSELLQGNRLQTQNKLNSISLARKAPRVPR
jgi:hypothetical protein